MKDPLAVVEMQFILAGVTFPEPGEYRVELWADEHFIMDRRITAMKSVPPEQAGESVDEQ
jgi:hypothetical protein